MRSISLSVVSRLLRSNMSKCNADLVVQSHGGGVRYHCPKCDVRPFFGLPVAYWTNGPVPAGRKCEKNGKTPPKGARVFQHVGLL